MTTATIEIFARPVDKPLDSYQHLYFVSTDSEGRKKILRAGPEKPGIVHALTDDLKAVYVVIWDRVNTLAFRRTL